MSAFPNHTCGTDPLVAAADAYFAGLDAYGNADLTGISNEEENALCERLYGAAQRQLEEPGRIATFAGAHALVRFLQHDNEDWGQEVWKPLLAALEEFLRVQAASIMNGGRGDV
ncbi:hypothetical protein GCM10007874_11490 [Labrys miyagiensis]|uniref:CdiI immunity protein domain-containing protein n=1 Tax=Labrys miyagiensis TaxID=346912 RepID=A0ABQ6CCX1_9HYPH|nr:hypothetical protein [Labrys miyagiensis]GLS18133.1 hypothetical protein GCM10007874_11490 [Labrys miyagiensis]